MSLKELDGGLVALMEIHCKEMRKEYGHLRIDKLAADQPIPFPHRQMPTFFIPQMVLRKDLKIWFQLEKVLFDFYETPLDFPTYMGITPRQMGKATEANRLRTFLGLDNPMDVPIRSDIRPVDWNNVLYGRKTGLGVANRPSVGPGGHADDGDINIVGKSGLRLFDLTRQKPLSILGMDPGARLFTRLRSLGNGWSDWSMRRIDEDELPESEHTTDYRTPRGWKRIPKQIPNQAKPSPVLLALLKRSA